jgi:hypothetical protein
MPRKEIRKIEAAAVLARRPMGDLRRAVRASGKDPLLDRTHRQLAVQLTDALWWSYATPLGYATSRPTLDEMVRHVASKLRWSNELPDGDGWEQLHWLTRRLVPEGEDVSWDDLAKDQRQALERSLLSSVALSGSGATSAAAAQVGQAVLRFARTPIGRLLPRIPQVAPAWRTIRNASAVAAAVGTPMGLGLGLLALNQALGTNYPRFVPSLLAVGLVLDRPLLLPMDTDRVSRAVG